MTSGRDKSGTSGGDKSGDDHLGGDQHGGGPLRGDELQGQLIEGRYRLVRRIGAGGMSVVYLAERVGIGKPLAIKFLRSAFANLPGFVRRFEQEAHACSRLNHLNCVSVLDFGVAFGSPYLVMEYVSGEPLSALIARGPVDPRRAIGLLRQLLAGLQHAHGRQVVHRDLKPGNVMLTEQTGTSDFVKIMDFGTAQILTTEPGDEPGGTDIGTPWYMAPEQAAGHPTDQRTDLYSVGVIAFELLSGERPFVADEPMRVLQMHISNPIPSLRVLRPALGISPELEAVVVCAMQKRPADRFEDAERFDHALQKVPELRPRRPTAELQRADPAAVANPPPAAAVLGGGEARGRPWLWAMLLALLAAGLGVAALWLYGFLG